MCAHCFLASKYEIGNKLLQACRVVFERTAVRSGTKIGLLSLFDSVFPGLSQWETLCLLSCACKEKVILRVDILRLMSHRN